MWISRKRWCTWELVKGSPRKYTEISSCGWVMVFRSQKPYAWTPLPPRNHP